MLAAIATAAVSLLFPSPIVAVASDGPYVAVAEGRSTRDCDRVSIWVPAQRQVLRLGRRTSCEKTSTGSGVASLSIARNRVLWLHYAGGNVREWSLWTATTTRQAPVRLAFETGEPSGVAPIVIGGGDADPAFAPSGDVLPYAIGRRVVVLTSGGATLFTWDAPARVTALDSEPRVLVVAVEDGRVFRLDNGILSRTVPGSTAATSVGVLNEGIGSQRGRTLELVSRTETYALPLRAGERVVFGSSFVAALLYRGRIQIVTARGLPQGLSVAGAVASLDGPRFTFASGRRVTTRLIPRARGG